MEKFPVYFASLFLAVSPALARGKKPDSAPAGDAPSAHAASVPDPVDEGAGTAAAATHAAADTAPNLDELRQSKIYNHTKAWLGNHPSSFVATNVRGQGLQYAERRLAALDLVRRQRDFGVVSELMTALENDSFLSVAIIDILDEWKAKRAVPMLKSIAKNASRPQAVRQRANKAAASIAAFKPEAPPTF